MMVSHEKQALRDAVQARAVLTDESAMMVVVEVWRRRVTVDGVLRVTTGQAWLTRDGDPEDYVLASGEQLHVCAGDWVTAEPWRGGEIVRLDWIPSVSPAAVGHAQSGFLAPAVRAP